LKKKEKYIGKGLEKIKNNMNFEKGQDPLKSMRIGEITKRDFSSRNEFIQWIICNAKYINPKYKDLEMVVYSNTGIIDQELWEFISEQESFSINGVKIQSSGNSSRLLIKYIKMNIVFLLKNKSK
jgi:hypothetical protein